MFNMTSDVIKSSLQGVFGGLLGTGLYYAIMYFISCYPIIGTIAPIVTVLIVVIASYFGLKLFFRYASFSTIYQYVTFFSGASIGSVIGWIIWGIKKFC